MVFTGALPLKFHCSGIRTLTKREKTSVPTSFEYELVEKPSYMPMAKKKNLVIRN